MARWASAEAQGVPGQAVVVAAGADELEGAGLVVAPLGLLALEQEPFDLVGGVADDVVLGVQGVGVVLQPGPHVPRVGAAVLVLHQPEHQHLAGAKDIGRHPVEGRPVDDQAQIGFRLHREAADAGTVEGEVVAGLEQELLVVVQHMEAAFQVRETHGHGLDPLLVGQVLHALFTDLIGRYPVEALALGLEIHLLQGVVGDFQEVAQRGEHHETLLLS
jgi:hypothetical protein